MNLTEDFNIIFNGLQALQNHLEAELNALHDRIGYLEEKQSKDDEFFRNLEALVKTRNRS